MPAMYTNGRRFEHHRRRFFTPTVVLLSFNKPETVLWTIAKLLLLLLFKPEKLKTCDSFKKDFNPLCCTLSYSTISVSRVFKAPLMVILTLAREGAGII
jgi:hypothetical protein